MGGVSPGEHYPAAPGLIPHHVKHPEPLCVWRLVNRRGHTVELGRAHTAEFGQATMPTGVKRDISRRASSHRPIRTKRGCGVATTYLYADRKL
jgi:hypothetical protein